MGKLYKIAFKGEVADGFNIEDVRSGFAERFRKDMDIIDKLFSGSSFTLAKGLEFHRASAAAGSLRSIGAIVYLVDEFGEYFEVSVSMPANESSVSSGSLKAIQPEPERSEEADTVSVEQLSEADVDTVQAAETATDEETATAEQADDPDTGDTPAAEGDNTDPYDLTATAKVRHLTQITDRRTIPLKAETDVRRTRIRYRFDTFMAKGGGSIFKALVAVFVTTFLVIGLLRGVLTLFAPDIALQHEDVGFWGNLYITFLEITDPGNMAQDIYSSVGYKVFAVLAGLAGIVMLSALIAFITTSLKRGSMPGDSSWGAGGVSVATRMIRSL